MLVLGRKSMERIQIGDRTAVTVLEIRGSKVRMGIDAPRHIDVLRSELQDQVCEEHRTGLRSLEGNALGEGKAGGGTNSRRRFTVGRSLYCGNLDYSVSSSDLETLFSQFGSVQGAQVIADRDTGRSKGFGFVEMSSEAEAQAAIRGLNETEHNGRTITVNEAKPRESRGGGHGSSGYGGRGRDGYGSAGRGALERGRGRGYGGGRGGGSRGGGERGRRGRRY